MVKSHLAFLVGKVNLQTHLINSVDKQTVVFVSGTIHIILQTFILFPPIFQPFVSLTAACAYSILLYKMRAIPFSRSNTT